MPGKPVVIPPDAQLVDIPTAAAMLSRCKRVTVRNLQAGGVPVRWLGGKRLYRVSDIQAFIDSLTAGGPTRHAAQFQKGSNVPPGKKAGAK